MFVAPSVIIGNHVKVQNYVAIYKGVTIRRRHPSGTTHDVHERSVRLRLQQRYTVYETWVRRGASVGANATIVCGVTLNEYCIVAADAVIVANVPAFALATGNRGV